MYCAHEEKVLLINCFHYWKTLDRIKGTESSFFLSCRSQRSNTCPFVSKVDATALNITHLAVS